MNCWPNVSASFCPSSRAKRVGGCAGRERHDEPHGLVGICACGVLRARRRGPQYGKKTRLAAMRCACLSVLDVSAILSAILPADIRRHALRRQSRTAAAALPRRRFHRPVEERAVSRAPARQRPLVALLVQLDPVSQPLLPHHPARCARARRFVRGFRSLERRHGGCARRRPRGGARCRRARNRFTSAANRWAASSALRSPRRIRSACARSRSSRRRSTSATR